VSQADALTDLRQARGAVLAADENLELAKAQERLARVRVQASRCSPDDAAAGSIASAVAEAEAAVARASA
jgi:hypothetical protein